MLDSFLFLLLLILKTKILCIDIKVSLGKKIGVDKGEAYPVSLTLNEPLLNKKNPIDLHLIFDRSSKMNIFHLKRLLNLTVDALDSEDRLSMISYSGSNPKKFLDEKNYLIDMNDNNKKKIKNKIKSLNNEKDETTNFGEAIRHFSKYVLRTEYDGNRVNSVIFIAAANNTDIESPKNNLKSLINNIPGKDFHFTFHTLSLNEESKGQDLLDLSNYRDGSYYPVNDFIKAKNSILNIIGGLKTTKYNHVKINVKINNIFNINTIFGYKHISNTPSIQNGKQFDIEILQFITGKDYTYIFLVDFGDYEIKNGENILKITVEYNDFFTKEKLSDSKILYYSISVNYLDPRKDEMCRVRVFDAIYDYKINEIDINNYIKRIERISKDCEGIVNRNFSDLMYDVYNCMEMNNWIYGSVSEGFLKRGGINLWYSNAYQLELINKFSKIIY